MLSLTLLALLTKTIAVFAADSITTNITTNTTTTTMPHLQNSYGWCVDLAVGNQYLVKTIGNGAIVALNSTCDANSPFQQWSLTPSPNNNTQFAIQLVSNGTAYCVDLQIGQLHSHGAWLQMLTCDYNPRQLWTKLPSPGLPQPAQSTTPNVAVFQLVNVGSLYCLDQNPDANIEHLAQWGCYPQDPSDSVAQTWNELLCPSTGCNVTSIQPTFVPGSHPSPSTATSTPPSTSLSTISVSTTATVTATPAGSDSSSVNVSVLGGAVSAAVIVGITAGVAIIICLRRSHRLKARKESDEKGGDQTKFEGRNSNSIFVDPRLADSLVLSAIHYNKPEDPSPERTKVDKQLVERPLIEIPQIHISKSNESLVEETWIDDPVVEESLASEPFVEESLIEERLGPSVIGGSVVGESSDEESPVNVPRRGSARRTKNG